MVALPVPVASMCYSIAEAMGWKSGLSEQPWDASFFYMLISAALFLAAAANLFRLNPIKALYWSQILAGIHMVPILLFPHTLQRPAHHAYHQQPLANFWIVGAAGASTAAMLVFLWLKLVG